MAKIFTISRSGDKTSRRFGDCNGYLRADDEAARSCAELTAIAQQDGRPDVILGRLVDQSGKQRGPICFALACDLGPQAERPTMRGALQALERSVNLGEPVLTVEYA